VVIAYPALAVSSYTRNPTGSGNRRQMATPSRSNLTIRWVDLNLLLSKHSSASTYHLQVSRAFPSRENGSAAGISGRWRHHSGRNWIIRKADSGLLLVGCETFFVQLPPFSSYFAIFLVVTTGRKLKPPLGGAAYRK
jgi:hypothetical protein